MHISIHDTPLDVRSNHISISNLKRDDSFISFPFALADASKLQRSSTRHSTSIGSVRTETLGPNFPLFLLFMLFCNCSSIASHLIVSGTRDIIIKRAGPSSGKLRRSCCCLVVNNKNVAKAIHLRIGIPSFRRGGLTLPCVFVRLLLLPLWSSRLALRAKKLLSLTGLRLAAPGNPPPGIPLMLPR